jgi:hypothetical protein
MRAAAGRWHGHSEYSSEATEAFFVAREDIKG